MESRKEPVRSRRRKLTLTSDSEDETRNAERDKSAQRRSSRIYGKQHKPEFRLPSRDTIWNDIPSVTTTSALRRLTPKKTVNNFTKVYNNYNYDDFEDTSDDDSSIETSDSGEEKEKQHRIKNYHKRLQVPSSSSDDDDDRKLDGSQRKLQQTAKCLLKEQEKTGTVAVVSLTGSELVDDSRIDADLAAPTAAVDSEDSNASDILSPSRNGHLKNCSVLLSDDDSAENDDNNSDKVVDSHEEQDSVSGSSENDSPLESRRCTLEKQKLKQLNMFQKLKEAQAKRKRSISKT
ncbi:unnamed protein product [Candidula unifasciata]|uniref:Uncharacterized protein n=1 Tax=Candidula unifasciata TaxID=100452 RepID=A0A8S3YKI0_9EUPU|nr:unnamed protein product [Candidula unifasciata]